MSTDVYTKEDAFAEGEQNVIIDELSQVEGDLSADDLRRLAGAEGESFSDEELLTAWQKAQTDSAPSSGAAGVSGQQPGGSTSDGVNGSTAGGTAPQRSWKFFDAAGKPAENVDSLTLKDFLSGKIAYNALGKEEQRSLDDLIRVAQFGHLNQTKLSMAQQEQLTLRQELNQLRTELGGTKQERQSIDRAFQQFHMGNEQPLRELLAKHRQALGGEPQQAAAPTASNDQELEQRGQEFYYSNLQPAAHQLADRYGVQRSDVEAALQQRLANEPNLTVDKLNLWLQYEIPMEIEAAGFQTKTTAAPGTPSSSASTAGSTSSNPAGQLEKRLAELEAKLANQTTADVRSRRGKIPSVGAGRDSGNQPSGQDAMIPPEALKSREAFKKYLGN